MHAAASHFHLEPPPPPSQPQSRAAFPPFPLSQDVQHLHRSDLSCTYDDRDIDTAFRDKAEPLYRHKLLPAANLPKQIGT